MRDKLKRKIKIMFISAAMAACVCGLPVFYLFFTNIGSTFLTKVVVSIFLKPQSFSIETSRGSLSRNLVLEGVTAENIKGVSGENKITVGKLSIGFTGIGPGRMNIQTQKAELILPRSEPVLLEGKLERGILDFMVTAARLDLKDITGVFFRKEFLAPLSGDITDAKFFIKGSRGNPMIEGSFKAQGVLYEKLMLQDCRVLVHSGLKIGAKEIKAGGCIEINDAVFSIQTMPDSIIKIQKIEIPFKESDFTGGLIKVQNGTAVLPELGEAFFYGTYHDSSLDANLYTKRINIRNIFNVLAYGENLKDIGGTASDVDIYIKGTVSEPEFSGKLNIQKLYRDSFSLYNCAVSLDLRVSYGVDKIKMYGTVVFSDGDFSGERTAVIRLSESRISFNGDPQKPSLAVKGSSSVEGVKIDVALKGHLDTPEIIVSSDPSFSQEKIFVMLLTGKRWQAAESSLSQGQVSADLTKDFLDYFLFAKAKEKLFRRLGISDISVTWQEDKRGISIEKAFSEKVDAKYSIEQTFSKEAEADVSQRVGGEYKITDTISIGAEKELIMDDEADKTKEKQKTDDKIFLEFKKEF